MLARGETTWRKGDRVRVYRSRGGWRLASVDEDARDYDVDHYVRALRVNYASRLARALRPDDFVAVFSDPEQPSLFTPDYASMRPILTPLTVDL